MLLGGDYLLRFKPNIGDANIRPLFISGFTNATFPYFSFNDLLFEGHRTNLCKCGNSTNLLIIYPIIARISRVGVRTEELRQKMTHMLHNTSWCHLHLLLLTKLFQFLTPPKSCTLNALCGLRFRPFLKSYLVELTFC